MSSVNNETNYIINSITFDSTAGAFTITGNKITLKGGSTGGITDNSTSAENIAFNATSNFSTGTETMFVTSGGSLTLGSVWQGAFALTKTGAGTLVLSANQSYTLATTVNAGNLQLTGTGGISSSAVTIGNSSAAAVLSGTGTLGAGVTTVTGGSTSVAHIAPGLNTSGNFGSAGTLTVGGGLTLGAGTELDFDLSSSATSGNDLISMGGAGTLTLNGTGGSPIVLSVNQLGSSLATGTAYTLISGAGSIANFNASDFSVTGDTGYTAAFTDPSGTALDVTFTLAGALANGYFNGLSGGDLTTAGAYDTSVSGGSASTSAPTSATNIFFSANDNASNSTPFVGSAGVAVNSVTFGTGTGVNSGITVAGPGTLTVEGGGITISGGGSDTINAPVALGAAQTWTPTSASSVLTVGGSISGTGPLTTAGAGTVILTSANTYTGGTVVSSGKLYVNNTYTSPSSGSGTGTGPVSVSSGATLGGSGSIQPGTGAPSGVTVGAGGTLYSGASQALSTGAVIGTGLTLDNSVAALGTANGKSILSVSGTGAGALSANLTFALGSGGTPAPFNYATPNTNSTYLNIVNPAGDAPGEISFSGTDSVTIVDLTNGGLQLNLNTPYLLIKAANDGDYAGLVTSLNGVLSLDGNGYVVGVGTSTTSYTSIAINQLGSNDNPLADPYYNVGLYLYDGDLELVPEPGTWALMLGGFAVLLFWQHRGRKVC